MLYDTGCDVKRTFVYALAFEDFFKGKETLQEEIEKEILKNQEVGDVIQGTGGVRKFRLPDPRRGKGKRGGLRIFYLDLSNVQRTHVLWLLEKGEKEDLSPTEKNALYEVVQRIKAEAKSL